MRKKVSIINGPNLNLLGRREPEIYGSQSFEDYFTLLQEKYTAIDLYYFQTNHEGDIIDKLHEVGFDYDGIILNAGGYTHTSIAIADAIKGIETIVVEVHISNIYEREKYRHHSFIKEVSVKSIIGKGLAGYDEAIEHFI
ncbi:MAG: 3-dehydroquinate dehydratase [Saprospiraceae bacterium]|nr:3-dehydroquinate dehydratase [Saprospiraceae bacterium]|tara:strand:- start:2276 stop:2695 length:420 start_codon:yes stop_codon:yes gene_type:complete